MADDAIKSLEEFKAVDQATRDYFVYTSIANLDRRFAGKWVEKTFIWASRVVGGSLLLAIIYLVIRIPK